jgi:Transglutaminase-like superfamily
VSSLRRFLSLSRLERRLLVRALVLIPLTRISTGAFGFGPTKRWLGLALPLASSPARGLSDEVHYDAAVRMIRAAAARGLVGATCLHRSLVLWALMRRRGLNPSLRFGVRKKTGEFQAHAWVELGSAAWDSTDGLHSGFVRLVR